MECECGRTAVMVDEDEYAGLCVGCARRLLDAAEQLTYARPGKCFRTPYGTVGAGGEGGGKSLEPSR